MLRELSESKRAILAESENRTASGHLRALAFTHTGHAIEIPKIYQNDLELILAQHPVYKSFRGEITACKIDQVFRESMAFTAAELGTISADVAPYTVVGYTVREMAVLESANQNGEMRVIGKVVPAHVFGWSTKSLVPVVALIPKIGFPVRVFGLIKPRNGLSTPYSIDQSEVFFRAEYRGSDAQPGLRYRDWNQMIATTCQKLVRQGRVWWNPTIYKAMCAALEKGYIGVSENPKKLSRPSTSSTAQTISLEDSDASPRDKSRLSQSSNDSSTDLETSSVGLDSSSLTATRASRIKKSIDTVRGWEEAALSPHEKSHEQRPLSTTNDVSEIAMDASEVVPEDVALHPSTEPQTMRSNPIEGATDYVPESLQMELVAGAKDFSISLVVGNPVPTPTTFTATGTIAEQASGDGTLKRKSDDAHVDHHDESHATNGADHNNTNQPTKRRRLILKYKSGSFEKIEILMQEQDAKASDG